MFCVCKFIFCKVPDDKGITSSLIINTIRKIDISKRLDAGNTDFRNEGQAIRFHTNSYELTFYDKMKDLEQAKISDKRAIELDNAIQLNLFSKEELIRNEVLRMEIRLNKKQKIKEMLKICICTYSDTTFEDLFDKEISMRILKHFFDKHIMPSLNIVLLSEENSQEIFCKIKQKSFSNNKILQIIGALQIIKDAGIRTLKSVLESRNFYRLKKDLEEIKIDENYLFRALKRVRLDIIEMQSLRIEGIKVK